MFDITTDTSEYKSFRVIFTSGSAVPHIDVKAVDWTYTNDNDLVFSKEKINDDEDDIPNEYLIATFDAIYVVGVMENNF